MKINFKKLINNSYFILPIFLQNVACSYFGFLTKKTRFGGNFKILLSKAIERKKNFSFDQMEDFKNKKLQKFIKYCYEEIPYYKKQFDKLGINPNEIKSAIDLKKLPILNKSTVLENYELFKPRNNLSEKLVFQSTSGTTGSGLSFYSSISSFREQWAIWQRYRISHGITTDYWCACFGGRKIVPINQEEPPFWRINYFGKEIRFSVYHTTPKNLDLYIQEIKKRNIKWIHGNPSSIRQLAFRVVETNKESDLNIKFVSFGAENVTEEDTIIIKRAFGIKPIQHYGQSEGVANISQCRHGNLIIDEDFSYVELKPSKKKNQYQIIGTNFNNYQFPLLRYNTGDIASVDKTVKKCCCNGRFISDIEGRLDDYIVLQNGARIQRLDFILKGSMNIRCSQFIQKIPGEADLLIVKGKFFTEQDENIILNASKELLGREFLLRVKYVEKINLSKSGKYNFIINNIENLKNK